LFTMRRLEDFVPADHPLRPIRAMVNEALLKMDGLFAGMYEADIKGGRPSIAPEKLLRAMLVQIFFSVRSERQLMEQTQYNLLYRWFIGLAMDDAVWVPSVSPRTASDSLRTTRSSNCSTTSWRRRITRGGCRVSTSVSMAPSSRPGPVTAASCARMAAVTMTRMAMVVTPAPPRAAAPASRARAAATTPTLRAPTPTRGCTARARRPVRCATWAIPSRTTAMA
ncbi:Transposase domain, partial [Variovorax sp. OK212]